ncbi:glycerophosphoryl diester phosphodiesterase family protein [Propionicimonas paludicola]|uniref:Glycerophosphoryl diester phosphodiesterase family protein n=2 Tax=Propionicimonas paludicola TaxID=185243 RepID=A0A2A9CQE8_9ACTN|nr:glycerophosphoryl diester phosphodiesterase family protein [Propionicimonas paludicola]
MLRPSPMDLTGLAVGTWEAVKRRAALLIAIWVPPTLVSIAASVAVGVVAFAAIGAAINDASALQRSAPGLVAGLIVVVGVVALAVAKAQGMSALAAYEIGQGERPTFGGVWTRSRGFLLRMAPVIALFVAALVLVLALGAGVVAMGISAVLDRSEARILGALGLYFLLVTAQAPVTWWLKVKLLYTVQAVAIEQASGFAAMRRSWTLTRGAFWRTLGYYLVGSLAIGMVVSPVVMLGQAPLIAVRFPGSFDDLPRAWATLSSSLPWVLVAVGMQLLAQVVSEPLIQTYTTYLFIDQVRRSELPPAPERPRPPAGYSPAPSPRWGQSGPAYPPGPSPMYPPQPGPGYPPPPGPAYPPPPVPGGGEPSQGQRPSNGWQPPS